MATAVITAAAAMIWVTPVIEEAAVAGYFSRVRAAAAALPIAAATAGAASAAAILAALVAAISAAAAPAAIGNVTLSPPMAILSRHFVTYSGGSLLKNGIEPEAQPIAAVDSANTVLEEIIIDIGSIAGIAGFAVSESIM